ncbi:MAG: Mrp/NBP35 family ATP-binding protein [Saprospiraceae bacterium]
MIDNNKVVDTLRKISDPVTGMDIVTSRRISNLKIEENNILFTLMANTIDEKTKAQLNSDIYSALKIDFPNAEIHIHMNQVSNQELKELGGSLPHIKNIIAVASGKGGVGKSTISVNTAIALSQMGFRVGLIDADLYGPSIPTMMGLKGQKPEVKNVYGNNKLIPIEKYGIHTMSIGFIIAEEQAVILRGPRLSGIIKQFITETIWPELDYLIVDLPPGTGDIQLTLVQTVPVTGGLIVTTPQDVAIVDAVKAMNMFMMDNIKIPIIGVVENMSWFTPVELPDNQYFIFGKGGGEKLVKKSNSTLIAQIPLVQGLRESGDNGIPAAYDKDHPLYNVFMEMAKKISQQVAKRNANMEPTKQVHIKT